MALYRGSWLLCPSTRNVFVPSPRTNPHPPLAPFSALSVFCSGNDSAVQGTKTRRQAALDIWQAPRAEMSPWA